VLQKRDGVEKMSEREKTAWFKKNPYPSRKDGFNSGGYKWCCDNWGTKWGIVEPVLEYTSSRALHYRFDTAWSPPVPLIAKMGEKFPKLDFVLRFYEPGMGFRGKMVIKKGVVARLRIT
jgi:hypothetical protein